MALSVSNFQKFLVSACLPALKGLPPRAAIRIIAELGRIEYTLNLSRRLRYRTAVKDAALYFGETWDGHRMGREIAANQCRWRARDLLLDGLSDAQADPFFHVTGREHLVKAAARDKGVVLLFDHFGAFLMPAHWLMRQGYPVRWFTERPRHISRLASKDFTVDGPLGQRGLFISRKLSAEEGGAAIRRAVRILKAGMIVQLAGDVRWDGARSAPGRFLGHEYRFTTTWISLAALSGSPVLPVFSVMLPDGTYTLEFLEPYEVPPDALRSGIASELVQRNLDAIEARVRLHPDNSLDYLFWSESDVVRAA